GPAAAPPGAPPPRPYTPAEVLAPSDDLLAGAERGRSESSALQEVEGALAQLALSDLLQTLAANRRTGRVTLRRGSERGEVDVVDGRPVDARAGAAQGEKALFRLLGWHDGSFSFQQGPPSNQLRIVRSIDELLLDAARHMDETNRLLAALPEPHVRWAPAPGAAFRAVPPVARALLSRLETPRTLSELLDLVEEPDLAVLQSLAMLHGEGLVHPLDLDAPPAPEPLLTPAESHALRARLQRGRPSSRTLVAKVLLAARDATVAREALGGLPVLAPEGAVPESLGTVAELELAEGLRVAFCARPGGELARPLWRPFSSDATGMVLVEVSPLTLALARFVSHDQHVPVAVLGSSCPDELRRWGGTAHETPREAVRSVLLAHAGL